MNRAGRKRFISQFVLGLGVVALCTAMTQAQADTGMGGNNGSAPAAAAGQRTDGQIEMDVVHALDASAQLKNDLITAATIQSEVTLSGTVSSQSSKDLAESIAKGVPGVTKVNNNLTIGDPQQAAEAQNLPNEQTDTAAADQPQMPPQSEPAPAPESAPDAQQAQAPQQPYPPAQPGYPTAQQPYPGQQPYPPQPYPGQQPYPPQPYPGQRPPYPQQPQQYGQSPYGQQPQYGYQQPTGPVTIPAGTLLQLRTSEAIDSKRAVSGTPVQFTVIQDVTSGGALAIPRGASVHGVITDAQQTGKGKLAGHDELALTLTSLDLGGQTYPLQSDEFRIKGPGKGGRTAGNAIAGGLLGTIIGCAAGGGVGCAAGAGIGTAAGVGASAASNGPGAWIPSEAQVSFHLNAPLTVNPVSPQEAARLAQGLNPGGPNLYRRPGRFYRPYPYGYPYGYPAYPYGYAYPPIYFRPYYMMGGVYYWR